MSEFYDINELSIESSENLALKYNNVQLNKMLLFLNKLDQENNALFIDFQKQKNASFSNLTNIFKNKEKIQKLKEIVSKANSIYETRKKSQEGSLIIVSHNKVNVAVAENIVVNTQELKAVNKEIDLGTSINTDKQFFYNYRQKNMEVVNEVSFEMEMLFEPLAPIPLRLQHKPHPLNQEISFEVSFF